jgi:hypothetical protein
LCDAGLGQHDKQVVETNLHKTLDVDGRSPSNQATLYSSLHPFTRQVTKRLLLQFPFLGLF